MAMRTFIALDLDEPIREGLIGVIRQLDGAGGKVRWVEPENLHVTLKFLGDVQDGDLPAVLQAVADAAGEAEPFDFEVCGVQCIPPTGALRMIWTGVREPTGRLAGLFERLESALAPLGHKPEGRQFHPHITLGRVRTEPRTGALRAAAAGLTRKGLGTQQAVEVVSYSSQLTPQGPIHSVMARTALARQM